MLASKSERCVRRVQRRPDARVGTPIVQPTSRPNAQHVTYNRDNYPKGPRQHPSPPALALNCFATFLGLPNSDFLHFRFSSPSPLKRNLRRRPGSLPHTKDIPTKKPIGGAGPPAQEAQRAIKYTDRTSALNSVRVGLQNGSQAKHVHQQNHEQPGEHPPPSALVLNRLSRFLAPFHSGLLFYSRFSIPQICRYQSIKGAAPGKRA
jgi:hypothetical protein